MVRLSAVEVAEAIVSESYENTPCQACGWLVWEHQARPENCQAVTA